MKSYNYLFEQILSLENRQEAIHEASLGSNLVRNEFLLMIGSKN